MRVEAGSGASHTFLRESLHLISKTVAFLADPVALRHPHIVEEYLRCIGGAHPHLVELAGDLHALALHRHADQRLVAMDLPIAGIGEQADPVGLYTVGYPHLAAIHDVVVAIGTRA